MFERLFVCLFKKCKLEVEGEVEVEGWFAVIRSDLKTVFPPEPLTCSEDGLDQLAPQGPTQCLDPCCVVGGWAQVCQAVGGGVWPHNDFLWAGERISLVQIVSQKRCSLSLAHAITYSLNKTPPSTYCMPDSKYRSGTSEIARVLPV